MFLLPEWMAKWALGSLTCKRLPFFLFLRLLEAPPFKGLLLNWGEHPKQFSMWFAPKATQESVLSTQRDPLEGLPKDRWLCRSLMSSFCAAWFPKDLPQFLPEPPEHHASLQTDLPKTTNYKPLHLMPPSKLTCPTPKHMKRLGLVVLLGGGTQTPEIELLSIPETPSSPKKITGVKSPRMVGHPWHSKRVHVPALWISVFPFSPSRWRGVIHMPWLLIP